MLWRHDFARQSLVCTGRGTVSIVLLLVVSRTAIARTRAAQGPRAYTCAQIQRVFGQLKLLQSEKSSQLCSACNLQPF